MRPEKAAEIMAWLAKAKGDLRAIDVDLRAVPPLVDDALFHAQQAAEKAMKAFLTAHDSPFRKTHDLDELGSACESIAPELATVLERARDLSVFAWAFRYPGDIEVPAIEEVRDTIACAEETYNLILSLLPDDVVPR